MSVVTGRARVARVGSISLRTQLVVLLGLLLVLAVVVTSLVAISTLKGQLGRQTDQELRANVSTFLNAAQQGGTSTLDSSNTPYSVFLLDSDGNTMASSQSKSATTTPMLTGWDHTATQRYSGTGVTVPSVDGSTQWRVMPFDTGKSGRTLLIATPMTAANSAVAMVTMLSLTYGVATLLAAIALGWVLVTRAFEPLARVERTAARIANGDLSQRVESYSPGTEIGRLSQSLNAMLTRIEEAFDAQKRSEVKMRRFVGDASHELRTPLVSIRGYSELYRHGALQTEEDVAKAMSRIESEAKRMSTLVEDLLTLARMDERRPSQSRRVDLLTLAQDAAADASASAPDREIEVVGLEEGPALPAPVWGDDARLRQVVANLVTNALRYTPEGTPLELGVGVEPGIDGQFVSVLEVIDHGPGIPPEEAEKVFERFYRADTSRTRETGGTGLGLAIVAAIVDQHSGTIRVEQTEGGGATMVVRIPQDLGEGAENHHPHTGEILD